MRIFREWTSRLVGTLRRRRRDRELEEELRLHLELAAEDARRRGDGPRDAARAARLQAGGMVQTMEALRDQRGLPWLDGLGRDVVFAWRQINKHRTVSIAVILSLGLAIGATTAAFRLVDAVLLRPLPVSDPDRLSMVTTMGVDWDVEPQYRDDFDYPSFRAYREAAGHLADLMVIGMSARLDVTWADPGEPERVYRQLFSGNVFGTLGLQPAAGRLLGPGDDRVPGGHPVAVISYDYWTRRFGRDPGVTGRTFRAGSQTFEIIGVAPKGFTGTEPGRVTDVFMPATMNVEALEHAGWSWFRLWLRPKDGVTPEPVRELLQTVHTNRLRDRLKSLPADTPRATIDAYLSERVNLLPAGAGASGLQRSFRLPLSILAALVGLVLLIACANVANLLAAQAMSRAREMALRLSIGAGRRHLIRLVLVESALLAIGASAVGALFAWWSAPFVVSLLAPAQDPVRLVLDAGWRVLAFGVALAMLVTLLLGLVPAVRASSLKPLAALKGADDPHAHRRLTNGLIAAQMAFCVFVLFVAGLFVASFGRLATRPLGFSDERILLLETQARERTPQPTRWAQVQAHLRNVPGVESTALAGWTPLTENRWRGAIRLPGRAFESTSSYFLEVSPAYFDTMRIGMIEGRDFRPGDAAPKIDAAKQPLAGVGIVNEAFARAYFGGENPVGRQVSVRQDRDNEAPMEIVGLVRDTVYASLREEMRPIVYLPAGLRNMGVLIVRTAGEPLALAPALRREVSRADRGFTVRNAGPQSALALSQMIRERLLATLSMFFAVLALLLAGVGLYGVLNYTVIRQQREIGVRMALGARAAQVVRGVTARMLVLVSAGALAGLAGGLAFARLVQSLLYEVQATDPLSVGAPVLTLAAAALLAALPPAMRAARTDPAQTLRAE